MNEFEWRRQMRDLREPLAPRRELWSSIDAALDAAGSNHAGVESAATQRPSKRQQPWRLAASFAALALLGGGLATHYLQAPARTVPVSAAAVATRDWKPMDPRLAGAATQLDAARRELQQAIQQSPDSQALQRLLKRTEQQQTHWQQLAHEAS